MRPSSMVILSHLLWLHQGEAASLALGYQSVLIAWQAALTPGCLSGSTTGTSGLPPAIVSATNCSIAPAASPTLLSLAKCSATGFATSLNLLPWFCQPPKAGFPS